MNYRIVIFVFLLGISTFSHAQTRKIAHRSHGGQPNTFAMLMDEDHGGGPAIYPTVIYDVEPWVAKIRKHYEDQAKKPLQNAKVNPTPIPQPQQTTDSLNSNMEKTTNLRNDIPTHPSKKSLKREQHGAYLNDTGNRKNEVVPYPLAKRKISEPGTSKNESLVFGIWGLACALLLTIGPSVYLVARRDSQ